MHANHALAQTVFYKGKSVFIVFFLPMQILHTIPFCGYGIFFFLLPWVSVAECKLSLIAVGGWGSSLVAVYGLLIAVASFTPENGLWSTGSEVVVHGISCPEVCGVFWDQESNLCPLHW